MSHQMEFLPPSPVKYIPAWFPGATFQKIATRSSYLTGYIRYKPWSFVLERVCTLSESLSCIPPKTPMQLTRPEGYEDCMASKGIEKVGASNTLRDAIAIMYSGTSPRVALPNNPHVLSPLGGAHTVSPCVNFLSIIRTDFLKDKYYSYDLSHLCRISPRGPEEDS